MHLSFQAGILGKYISSSQKIRVLSESWFADQVYCPNCGQENMSQYKCNRAVADFLCPGCDEDYELKSKKGVLSKKLSMAHIAL